MLCSTYLFVIVFCHYFFVFTLKLDNTVGKLVGTIDEHDDDERLDAETIYRKTLRTLVNVH